MTQKYVHQSLHKEARLLRISRNFPPMGPELSSPEAAPDPFNSGTLLQQSQNRLEEIRKHLEKTKSITATDDERKKLLRKAHTDLGSLGDIVKKHLSSATPEQDKPMRDMHNVIQQEQKSVAGKLKRLEELASNATYQFLNKSGLIVPMRGIGNAFEGLGKMLRDIGQMIGPAVESIIAPLRSAGGTMWNFMTGVVAHFSPQLAERMRAETASLQQREELMNGLKTVLADLTHPPRQVIPLPADQEQKMFKVLFDIRQRSGASDSTAFAMLLSDHLPAGAEPVTLHDIVAAATKAFPLRAPTSTPTAPNNAPPKALPGVDLMKDTASVIDAEKNSTRTILFGGTQSTRVIIGSHTLGTVKDNTHVHNGVLFTRLEQGVAVSVPQNAPSGDIVLMIETTPPRTVTLRIPA